MTDKADALELAQQNMREMAEAFAAMRNDLNELFPIQSDEADLLQGPEFSVACAAIVEAARKRAAEHALLHLKLRSVSGTAEHWKERAEAAERQAGARVKVDTSDILIPLENLHSDHGQCDWTEVAQAIDEVRRRILSALTTEATNTGGGE